MKKTLIFLLVFILVAAGLALFGYINRDGLVEKEVNKMLYEASSVEAEIIGLSVSSDMKSIAIKEIIFKNPAGYQQPHLAEVRKVLAECDVMAVALGKGLVCEKLTAVVEKIFVERKADGKVNIRDVKAVQKGTLEIIEDAAKKDILIKRVEFTFGEILLLEAAGSDASKESSIDLEKKTDVYGYVTDIKTLVQIPILKTLSSMNRGSLGIPRHLVQKYIMDTTGQV